MRSDMDKVPGKKRLTGTDHAPALEPTASPEARRTALYSVLAAIPAGKVVSYGELAAAVGRPGAARAVGAATGRNPLSILVPCHRLVGRDGALTGYAGGLERKRQLLAFEAATER